MFLFLQSIYSGLSTLRTWASIFTVQMGILTNELKLMKAKVIIV